MIPKLTMTICLFNHLLRREYQLLLKDGEMGRCLPSNIGILSSDTHSTNRDRGLM